MVGVGRDLHSTQPPRCLVLRLALYHIRISLATISATRLPFSRKPSHYCASLVVQSYVGGQTLVGTGLWRCLDPSAVRGVLLRNRKTEFRPALCDHPLCLFLVSHCGDRRLRLWSNEIDKFRPRPPLAVSSRLSYEPAAPAPCGRVNP